jgi:hypothetical protein
LALVRIRRSYWLAQGIDSRFNQPRQCGEAVLRIFVTGGPPNFGGGGMPHRIIIISRKVSSLRTTGAG